MSKINPYLIPIFPTPLGVINFGEAARDLNKRLIHDIHEHMNRTKSAQRTFSGTPNTWQSELGLEKKYESFRLLRISIEQTLFPIMKMTGYSENYIEDNIEIESLWANVIFGNGGWSQPHTHGNGNTFWSGVYYPKSEGSDEINLDDFDHRTFYNPKQISRDQGNLVLIDPAKIQKGIIKPNQKDSEKFESFPYYGSNITIEPRESLFIYFPAWLEHFVTPIHEFKENRYSISFSASRRE